MDESRPRPGEHGQRFQRRTVLRGAAGAGGLTALALTTACGHSRPAAPAPSPTGSGTQPKRGGVLVHAGGVGAFGSYDISSTQVDPHINAPPAARGFRLVYQGLLGYDFRTYEVQPELAQKWEQASPTELVFHLQPGVKWQNKAPVSGRELTADDVVFGLERMRTNDPRFVSRSLISNVDKIQAVDKSTVMVTTKGPDASVLSYLSSDPALVMAPEAVQKFDKFNSAESVVGTGAFILKSLEENVAGEYVRNPDFWKAARPYLDGVRTQNASDQSTAYAAFQAGQMDILLLPGQETKSYLAKQAPGFKADWYSDDTVFPMLQPNTKATPMNDARVTRALRLLIDHDEFITAYVEPWYGRGRHGGVLPLALEGWDLSNDEYSNQLEWKKPKDDAAKEGISLLSAAGYTKDSPLTFEVIGGDPSFSTAAMQLVQAQWAKWSQGAVKTTLKLVSAAEQNAVRANRTFTVFVGGNSAAFPEVDAYFNTLYATGASRNYTGFSDPKFDEMAQKQRTILNVAERKSFVKDAVKYLLDNLPSTMLVNRYFLNGVKPKVHGFAPEFFINGRQYEAIWME